MQNNGLKIKYEMLLEAFEQSQERCELLQNEVDRLRLATKVISDGIGILQTIAWDAKPQEYEILCKDYAPFKNLMDFYFGKPKKLKR